MKNEHTALKFKMHGTNCKDHSLISATSGEASKLPSFCQENSQRSSVSKINTDLLWKDFTKKPSEKVQNTRIFSTYSPLHAVAIFYITITVTAEMDFILLLSENYCIIYCSKIIIYSRVLNYFALFPYNSSERSCWHKHLSRMTQISLWQSPLIFAHKNLLSFSHKAH